MNHPTILIVGGFIYLLAAIAVGIHAKRNGRHPILWFVACVAAPFTGFLIYGLWHIAGEPTYERSADAEVEAAERDATEPAAGEQEA